MKYMKLAACTAPNIILQLHRETRLVEDICNACLNDRANTGTEELTWIYVGAHEKTFQVGKSYYSIFFIPIILRGFLERREIPGQSLA